MCQSRDGTYISVQTSDGYIKVIQESNMKVILSQKRHNLPITACAFVTLGGDVEEPSHVMTGSADYTYNFIAVQSSSLDFLQTFVNLLV